MWCGVMLLPSTPFLSSRTPVLYTMHIDIRTYDRPPLLNSGVAVEAIQPRRSTRKARAFVLQPQAFDVSRQLSMCEKIYARLLEYPSRASALRSRKVCLLLVVNTSMYLNIKTMLVQMAHL